MAVLFSDNFNRADGALGAGWTTVPSGDVVVSGNRAVATSWDALAWRDIGISREFRISAWMSKDSWPALYFCRTSGGADYFIIRSTQLELIRRGVGGDNIVQLGGNDPKGARTIWAEVREIPAGTEIRWGYDSTQVNVFVDTNPGRPTGTRAGISLQNDGQVAADDFLVESLDAGAPAHTGTGTLSAGGTITGSGIVGGVGLAQVAYRFRNDDGSQTAATWKAAADTGIAVPRQERFRLRVAVRNTSAGSVTKDWQLFFSANGGAYEPIGNTANTTARVRAAESTHLSWNEATTQQISTGTFAAGTIDEEEGYLGSVTLAAGSVTEFEFSLYVNAAAVNGDVLDFRVYDGGWIALDSYSVTPRVTVGAGTVAHAGTGTLTGDGTVTATGSTSGSGGGSLAGTGTATASGTAATFAGVELGASGDVGGVGTPATAGTVNVPGSGTVTAVAAASVASSGTLTGDGGIAGAGDATQVGAGTAELAGIGTAIGAGGPVTIATSGTLAASGAVTGSAQAATAGAGTADGTGTVTGVGVTGSARLIDETFESYPTGTWAESSTHGPWHVDFNGFGQVLITTDGTNKVLELAPSVVAEPATTAALVTSTVASTGDVTVTARMRSLSANKGGQANPWECAWLFWNRRKDPGTGEQGTGEPSEGVERCYYVALKPNGWEIGKLDQEKFTAPYGGQRFLASGTTPTFPIGTTWRDVKVVQVGATITLTVDGTVLGSFTDGPGSAGFPAWDVHPTQEVYTRGAVGLYTEDARVQFDDVTLAGAPSSTGGVVLAGDGVMVGVGVASAAGEGSGVLSADGAATGVGKLGTITAAVAIAADGTVAAAGVVTFAATVDMAGTGSITGDGFARQAGYGTVTIDGDGTIIGAGSRGVEPPTHPGFGLRVACYDVDGDLRGRARGMLVERYARAGETGRLKVGFSKLAPRGELFKTPVEIAVEYLDADGVTWVEPEDGRYVIAQDDHERTADPTGSHDLNLLGIVQRLNAAKVLTGPPAQIQTDGKRQFLSKRPGEIIGTLLTEAKARGAFPTLIAGFTDTHDSNGDPWQLVYNRAYELNHSLLGILQNLYDGGAVDYWVEGRTLHMVPAEERGRDLTAGLDPVYLRDRYARTSPERDDWTKLANHAVLIGDEGARWEKTNHEAYAPFGRVETVILAGGVSNEATATLMMDRALAEGADVARQLTREWQWAPGIRWMPDRDIRVGDWVLADTAAGTRQRVRVADIMTRQGPDGIEAFVTLGTIHDDLQTRMAKRQIGIEGGAGVGSIGRPTPKPPPDPTNQWGDRPAGFGVQVSAWPIPGGYGGVIVAEWDEVTTDTGGFAFDPDGYVVRARRQGGAWMDMFRTTSLTGQAERADMRPGETWEAQVAAYRSDQTGVFSLMWSGQVPEDKQAPPTPSQPTGDSPPGQIVITWDGRAEGGGDMPLDTKRVEVSMWGQWNEAWTIPVSGGSFRMDAGELFQVGDIVDAGIRAVDWAGNASAWTQAIHVTIATSVQWPAAPGSLLASAETYLTPEGAYRGMISASWAEVTTDTAGDPLNINGYVVRARRTQGQFPTAWFDLIATTALSGTGSSPLMEVGDTWEVGAAATSTAGHTGVFSDVVEVVIPPDEVAPAVPSKPLVTSSRALLTVEWDGLAQGGGGMPPDLWYLTVHITGLTDTWTIDPITKVVHISGLTPGVTYEVRLTATDYADNTSDPSQPSDPVEVRSVMDDTDWQALMAKATSYGDNLYPDALFAEPGRNQIREQYGWTHTAGEGRATPTAPVAGQDRILWLTPTGSTDTTTALTPGDTYQLAWRIATQPTTATNITVVRSLDGQPPATLHAPIAQAANSDQAWNYTITATAGYRYGIRVTSGPTVHAVALRKRVTATMIEDGAIIADKIAVNHAMAAKFSGMLAEFDEAFVGVLTADMLNADALNFKSATGLILTAPDIQSTNLPNRGLKLTAGYKRVYNDTGAITLEENYTTGDITMTGRFQTRGAYPHLDIGRDLWPEFSGMRWIVAPGWQSNAEIKVRSTEAGGTLPGGMHIIGASWHDLTAHPEVHLRSGFRVNGEERFWPEVDIALGRFGFEPIGRIRLKDVGEAKTAITTRADFTELHSRNGQSLEFPVTGTVGDVRLRTLNGDIHLWCGSSRAIKAEGIASTSGGENLVLESGWRLMYHVSMSHMKLEKEDVPAIPAVLALQPKTWIDRFRREEDPDYDTRNFGFIAEEAETLIASLPDHERRQAAPLVQYFDRGGQLSKSIPYGQMVALLWPLVRALWEDRHGPINPDIPGEIV